MLTEKDYCHYYIYKTIQALPHKSVFLILIVYIIMSVNTYQRGWTARDMAEEKKMHIVLKMLKGAEEVL